MLYLFVNFMMTAYKSVNYALNQLIEEHWAWALNLVLI